MTNELIAVEDFCNHHQVTVSFITELNDYGLVEVMPVEKSLFIPQNELRKLEQLIRLHYDLEINYEGIDAIVNLLEKVDAMQSEIRLLQSRLSIYESNG